MKVMKLSTDAGFATRTTLANGLKQSSSALPAPPVEITLRVFPVVKSSTLTELGVVSTPVQLGVYLGPSAAQISPFFVVPLLLPSMSMTPFVPEIFTAD